MAELIYRITGRMSLALEILRPVLAAVRGDGRQYVKDAPFDKTGLVVKTAKGLPVWWEDEEILYIRYQNFAHSFWRAQEFSLFRNHMGLLEKPILDFGCGDGSFASALFDSIDCGVDNDPEALKIARQFGIYKRITVSSESNIPLESESASSIISNSVLEHLMNLEGMLVEFERILVRGGRLMITVPVTLYTEQLVKYFGLKASRRINNESYHRNLLSPEAWKGLLAKHGFAVEILRQYQPDEFTYWYRMFRLLGPRGLGFFFPAINENAWRLFGKRLVELVRKSITSTQEGGNIFVVCKKS